MGEIGGEGVRGKKKERVNFFFLFFIYMTLGYCLVDWVVGKTGLRFSGWEVGDVRGKIWGREKLYIFYCFYCFYCGPG